MAISRESPWQRLVGVVQALSMARDLATIMDIVRRAARELTGADGATFVLREEDQCYYAEEDAIAPLWKGKRFPMSVCISGWVMLHRTPAVIEDVYADPRIPADAYRPTFVKSLVMVPIRTAAPLGAIGNYWAERHSPSDDEVALLAALADTTSVAMESVQLYQDLENRVLARTAELDVANKELEAFSYSVSHDLRAPVRAVIGFSKMLSQRYGGQFDEEGEELLTMIQSAGAEMSTLIDALLSLSRIGRRELHREPVELSLLAHKILEELRRTDPQRDVDVAVASGLVADGDATLLRIVLENLLSNAWKYTSQRTGARIEIGRLPDSEPTFFVRDNGAGFDMAYASRLFTPFQRLHSAAEFPGTGIGLATVQRIVRRHGGRIWAEGAPSSGATFFFTLPAIPEATASAQISTTSRGQA